MQQYPTPPRPLPAWAQPPADPAAAAQGYGAQFGPVGPGRAAQQDPAALPSPQPVPWPPMAPLPAVVAQEAQRRQLGDPVSAHAETASPWRGGVNFLISLVALVAVPVVIETSGYETPDFVLRILMIAPAVTFLLWMAALNRRRKTAYVFENGLTVRKGAKFQSVHWQDVVALKYSSGNNPAGDIKIWLRDGGRVDLHGHTIPESAAMFSLVLRAAEYFGWPQKKPR
ncbi:hypothetical protein HNR23_004109 [Nocardiopsis mwathae]|uniref:PH domain-containing protein n=1 Tax=Nocardiopsis mwathae TaxID=1472723 RepID=A0A7X0D8I4_9ACTN|nr:hypothetical protein [Nocardiopsis mwathae]MBB6174049.1 hypothetical protein [Nocardiopsis mwathae]